MAANDSVLYIGTQDSGGGFLDAFNPANGTLLWQVFLGGEVSSTPAIAGDGTVFVATINGTSNGLFSINPSTHSINWFFQTDDPNNYATGTDSSPVVGKDCSVYFFAHDDLFSVNFSGQLNWFFPLPSGGPPTASPALDAAGNILIGSYDGLVYSIGPNGGLQWLFDTGTGSSINSSLALASNGMVVAATQSGIVFAITNGVAAWAFTNTSGAQFVSSPAISQDNVVVIGSEDNNVYGITNGAVEWSYQTGSSIWSSPAISPVSGAVLVASEDGFLYSLPGVSALATSPWPMFRANPSHTGAAPNSVCSSGALLVAFPNNPSMNTNPGFPI